jgi:N-acetylglucosamine-6-sulfatase
MAIALKDLDPKELEKARGDWGTQDPLEPIPGYFGEAPEEWLLRHARFCRRAAQGNARVLFIGDSITEAWCAPEGLPSWNLHFADLPAVNFAIGGDRTQQLLWRIDHGTLNGLDVDLIVLLIGVNNIWMLSHSAEQIAEGVRAVIGRLQERLPRARILLQGVLPTAQFPTDPYRALVSGINGEISRFGTLPNVRYVDFGDLFLEPDGSISPNTMPDFCHLSADAYVKWGEHLAPTVLEMLAQG